MRAKKIKRLAAFVGCLFFLSVIVSKVQARNEEDNDSPKFVSLDLLNKLSAKKHRIKIPIGSAYLIQDIRIVPRSCYKMKDTLYKINVYQSSVEIFLEQEMGDHPDQSNESPPILLYKEELSNNTRIPSPPVEHPTYDLILVECD